MNIKTLYNILSNIISRLFGSAISKIIGIFSLPIIANALGPSYFGELNIINIIISITLFLVSFGFDANGIRNVVKEKSNTLFVNNIISDRLTISLISVFISIIYCTIIYWDKIYFLIAILISYSQVISTALNLEFYYVGLKKMIIPAIMQTIGQLLYLVLLLLFVKSENDFILISFFVSLTLVIPSLLIFIYYVRSNTITIKLSFILSYKALKNNISLGIGQKIEQIIAILPPIIITLSLTYYDLGIYSAATKILTIVTLFYGTIFYGVIPNIVELKNIILVKRNKYIKILFSIVVIVGILTSIIIYFLAEPILIILFGQKFISALPLIKIMSISLVPLWIIFMFVGNLIIFFNEDKIFLKYNFIIFISLVLTLFLFINYWGNYGAIYSQFIAVLLGMIYGLIVMWKKYFKMKPNK